MSKVEKEIPKHTGIAREGYFFSLTHMTSLRHIQHCTWGKGRALGNVALLIEFANTGPLIQGRFSMCIARLASDSSWVNIDDAGGTLVFVLKRHRGLAAGMCPPLLIPTSPG